MYFYELVIRITKFHDFSFFFPFFANLDLQKLLFGFFALNIYPNFLGQSKLDYTERFLHYSKVASIFC